MNELKIKPCKELQLNICLWGCLAFTIVFEIISIFSKDWCEFLMCNLVLLGILLVIFIIYVLARVCYRPYFVFTENEIAKYKKGQVEFKIKKKDLVQLRYRKCTFSMFLLAPLGVFILNDFPCGILSIRYNEAEVEKERGFDGIGKMYLLTEEEKASGLKEYCEAFSRRDIKKITKILGAEIKEL